MWDEAALRTGLPGWEVHILPETPSTNDAALAAAPSARTPALFVAARQTAGRGRRGRRWFADPQASLAMTVLVSLKRTLAACWTLPLAAGLGVWRALVRWAPELRIKWPNDVLAPRGKVAGVLVETRMHAEGVVAAVGVGVNLFVPRGGFPALAQPAAALGESARRAFAREEVAVAIARELERTLLCWEVGGFAALREEWWRAHGGARPVRVRAEEGIWEGEAVQIGEDGALWVRRGARIVPVRLQEVEALG